jgi:mannose-1-phosphate guanylyltransferase
MNTSRVWALVVAGPEDAPPGCAQTDAFDHHGATGSTPSGSSLLLGGALEGTRSTIPLERVVVVVARPGENRDTGERPEPVPHSLILEARALRTVTGVMMPVHWVRKRDPGAIVVVFPSEQAILDWDTLMTHVAKMARFIGRHDREIVLLGARPTYPEPRYGWIETGKRITDVGREPVWRVQRLWERPSYAVARACYESGCLWNTSVVMARAETLVQASRRILPELDARLETAAALMGSAYQERVLEDCYAITPRASLSEILISLSGRLSVSRLPPILWSDVGSRRAFSGSPAQRMGFESEPGTRTPLLRHTS